MNQPAQPLKKVLHVGCSTKPVVENFRGPEWQEVRLDIDPTVSPDIVASMTDLGMIAGGEFDAVWSSHNIEHLFAHDVALALKEFYRVLKNGGGLYLLCPDLQTVAEYIVKGNLEGLLYQSPAGPISPIDTLYGLRSAIQRGNHFMAHRTGFTAATMANHLKAAGFNEIQVKRTEVDLAATAFKKPEIPPDKTVIKIVDKDLNKIMEQRDNIEKEPEYPEGLSIAKAADRNQHGGTSV